MATHKNNPGSPPGAPCAKVVKNVIEFGGFWWSRGACHLFFGAPGATSGFPESFKFNYLFHYFRAGGAWGAARASRALPAPEKSILDQE